MLLYARPLTRLLRPTTEDILHDDGGIGIRLGEPPTPVPQPFAGLLQQHIQERLDLTTDTIERRLRTHGVPMLTGRTAARRQLVLRAPAPVVTRMLGYTLDHTARLALGAGGTRSRHAPMTTPGDTRRRTGDR